MTDLIRLAKRLQELADEKGWRLCFIGGIALQRWGEPRVTVDVDASLLTGAEPDVQMVRDLLDAFKPRVEGALEFALTNRVVLLTDSDGIGIDVALACFPYEEDAFRRSSLFEFLPDVALRTVSAEDLVIMKAIAGRDKDWSDIKGVVVRQGARLDWPIIDQAVEDLAGLLERPEVIERLRAIRSEHA
ncbi:MAG: nucleotidyl transferase AbiEii/AbiGii toxin family protein [Armatimonadetes bacterium]|nr:nucleotidyl transferase AbiEii/AbiGii toxin family protein [Armatimonadota bacterium]